MKRRPTVAALAATVLLCSCASRAPAPAAAPAAPIGPSPVVARIGAQTITMAELDQRAAADLYEVRQKALEGLLFDRLLEPAAKQEGVSVDEYLKKRVQAKVPDVTEAEARAFFEKNKDNLEEELGSRPFDEVKAMIIGGLTSEKRQAAVGQVLDELRRKSEVKILLEAPRIEVAATGPARGPEGAKVTIIEFSDFQCPFCERGRATVEQVMKAYDGKVRLVFRDFPLSMHENAQKAAEAGQCAHEQGKFWPMHDWMFEHQAKLSVDDLKGAARTLGLDGGRFDACLTSGKLARVVTDSQKAGEKAGVKGTPAFFVNGVFVNGAQPFERFRSEIDAALSR